MPWGDNNASVSFTLVFQLHGKALRTWYICCTKCSLSAVRNGKYETYVGAKMVNTKTLSTARFLIQTKDTLPETLTESERMWRSWLPNET